VLVKPRGVHSLLYFAYTCVRDLFIAGVIYLAEKIIRRLYFTCKKHVNIICDVILHVHFLQKLSTINILDPTFYRTLFLKILPVNSPRVKLYSGYANIL